MVATQYLCCVIWFIWHIVTDESGWWLPMIWCLVEQQQPSWWHILAWCMTGVPQHYNSRSLEQTANWTCELCYDIVYSTNLPAYLESCAWWHVRLFGPWNRLAVMLIVWHPVITVWQMTLIVITCNLACIGSRRHQNNNANNIGLTDIFSHSQLHRDVNELLHKLCYWNPNIWCGLPLKLQNWINDRTSLIARFMGPTWDPPGADRTHVDLMLAPWTLLSGMYADGLGSGWRLSWERIKPNS